MKIRALPWLAAALLAASTGVAQAAATGTYYLNETFQYAATAVGSFHYDGATDEISDIAITVKDANGPVLIDTNFFSLIGLPSFPVGPGSAITVFLDSGHQTFDYETSLFLTVDTSGAFLTLVDYGGPTFGSNTLDDWRSDALFGPGQLQADSYVAQHSSLSMRAPVPEPAPLALMGLALLGFAAARRGRGQ